MTEFNLQQWTRPVRVFERDHSGAKGEAYTVVEYQTGGLPESHQAQTCDTVLAKFQKAARRFIPLCDRLKQTH